MKFLAPLIFAASAALFMSSPMACGQVGPCEVKRPGAMTEIRGYGYGYEGGERPVTLRWAIDRSIATVSQIDGNGDFVARFAVPAHPGLHKLVIYQGDEDPTPVSVTIPVVLPWYLQAVTALREMPATAAVALLASAGLGAAAAIGVRRRGRTEVAGVV